MTPLRTVIVLLSLVFVLVSIMTMTPPQTGKWFYIWQRFVVKKHFDVSVHPLDPPDDYTGTWTQWWPNGQLQFTCELDDGEMTGALEQYQEDGTPAVRGHFVDGEPVGEFVQWHHNGVPNIVTTTDAVTRRCSIHQLDISGRPVFSAETIGVSLDGPCTLYHPGGPPMLSMTFTNNIPHNPVEIHDVTGDLLHIVTLRSGDIMHALLLNQFDDLDRLTYVSLDRTTTAIATADIIYSGPLGIDRRGETSPRK